MRKINLLLIALSISIILGGCQMVTTFDSVYEGYQALSAGTTVKYSGFLENNEKIIHIGDDYVGFIQNTDNNTYALHDFKMNAKRNYRFSDIQTPLLINVYSYNAPFFVAKEIDSERYHLYNYSGNKALEEGFAYNDFKYVAIASESGIIINNVLYYFNGNSLERIMEVSATTSRYSLTKDLLIVNNSGEMAAYEYKTGKSVYYQSLNNNSLEIMYFFPLYHNKIVVQTIRTLPDDVMEYDYFDQGKKMKLETKLIDLLSGNERELKLDYIISGLSSLRGFSDSINLDNIENYSLMSVIRIKDKMSIGMSETFFVDQDLNEVLKELVGITPLGNSLYLNCQEEKGLFKVLDDKQNELFELNYLMFDEVSQMATSGLVMVRDRNRFYSCFNKEGEQYFTDLQLLSMTSFYNGYALGSKNESLTSSQEIYRLKADGTSELITLKSGESIITTMYGIYTIRTATAYDIYDYEGKKLASYASVQSSYLTSIYNGKLALTLSGLTSDGKNAYHIFEADVAG